MQIHVTQEDINSGSPHKCQSCPVALAMSRAFGTPIFVSKSYWCFLANSTPSADLPEAAQIFISRFDRDFPVEPFFFEA